MTLWRRLIERTHGWDPLKYVPLCVVLGGEKAVVTGCVRRDRLEVYIEEEDELIVRNSNGVCFFFF
jgi:hypothetical protein